MLIWVVGKKRETLKQHLSSPLSQSQLLHLTPLYLVISTGHSPFHEETKGTGKALWSIHSFFLFSICRFFFPVSPSSSQLSSALMQVQQSTVWIICYGTWNAFSSIFFYDLSVPAVVSHSLCSLLFSLWHFLPFLKYAFPEVLPVGLDCALRQVC